MKTIAIPIYGGKLIVARTPTEFDAAFKRLLSDAEALAGDEPMMKRLGGLTASAIVDSDVVIVTGVFTRHGSVRCHEAVHCAQALAEAVCMDPIAEKEAFAYLTQWFYEELAP